MPKVRVRQRQRDGGISYAHQSYDIQLVYSTNSNNVYSNND